MTSGSRGLRASSIVLATAALAGLFTAPACSSNEEAPGPQVACDNAKCAPGNRCITFGTEIRCRKTCASNDDPATSCPFGYACVAAVEGEEPFCIKEENEVTKQPAGQWGAPCNPSKGFDDNEDCDAAQGFLCFGSSPTDAESYCTRFDCQKDSECGAGFFCGKANASPNVLSDKRTIGATQSVCQRRAYCSPCNADVDCPALKGIKQHCVADDDGKGFCAPECTRDGNCNNEAKCVDTGTGWSTCYPRAGRCVGDGSVCSPCRSDADCPNGACVKGQYTTERTCTVHSQKACADTSAPRPGIDLDCPNENAAAAPVACIGGERYFSSAMVPANECHGVYRFSEGWDVGCWSPAR